MRRKIFSIFLGLFAGFFTFVVSHLIHSSFHPLAEDVDVQNEKQFREAMSEQPASYFVGTIICHGLAVSVASFVSSLMRGFAWLTAAFVPAFLFLLLALGVLQRVPHPEWFKWADLSVFLPAGFFGYAVAVLLLGTTPQELDTPALEET